MDYNIERKALIAFLQERIITNDDCTAHLEALILNHYK